MEHLDKLPKATKASKPEPAPIKEIKVGDTVYLKSGSPRLTVTAILGNDIVEVSWCKFDAAEMQVWNFPLAAMRVSW